ncbi:MAG: N-glycosyltransferase [Syntrophorhabdus sp. PtaU1.Bin050]|nr:MAG: N-glycosyltransferase [Syntrophorhabdus sp. PtaU1.Bin050]
MTLSVIIPVLCEEALINDAISRLKGMASDDAVEIIVVDGSAERETLRVVSDSNVKGIASKKGRARQMNAGAEAALGDVLLFLHADTELPPDGLQRISRTMHDDRFVGGAFDLAIDEQGPLFRIIERTASLRSRLTRVPYGDQAIFVKRDYFVAIGGYEELPLMEDVDLMRRIRRRGDKIFIIPEKVKTSGRRWKKEGAVRCTLRNRAIMLLYMLGTSPEKLAKWYP